MRALIVVSVLVGCTQVGPQDPAQSFNAGAWQPAQPTRQPCQPSIQGVPLDIRNEIMPEGFSDDEILDAAIRFAVSVGLTIDTKDSRANVAVTKPFTGQTLPACEMNEYRAYALRLVVNGGRLLISYDCWATFGVEATATRRAWRGQPFRCTTIGATDAAVSRNIAEGAKAMLQARQTPARFD